MTFLYKVVPGAAQKSYGLYVAQLAGLPSHVVQRAKSLLATWQEEPQPTIVAEEVNEQSLPQISTNGRVSPDSPQPLLNRLAEVDPLHTTPMNALVLLAELKKTR